jgi:hypothetical protein
MADNQFVIYNATTKTRWDAVAQWAYADPFNISPIIAANPHLIIEAPIPQGTKVLVPIKYDSTSGQLPSSSKPPWA